MLITVEVQGKYGPKGSDGVWYGIKKPLKSTDFEPGQTYDVEMEEWKEGRFNIVRVNKISGEPHQKPLTKAETSVRVGGESKDRRILVQGLAQAVVQSPALVNLPMTNVDEIETHVKELTKRLINFVLEESK